MATSERPFKGRTASVTGGIGRATVFALAAKGANVLINHRAPAPAAASIVNEIVSAGGRASASQTDLAEPGAAQQPIDCAMEEFGGLDILVNNAGITHIQQLGDGGDWSQAYRLWAVNTLCNRHDPGSDGCHG